MKPPKCNDRTERVGHDETVNIDNHRTETVNVDESLTIGRDQQKAIGRNRITKIEKDDILNIGNNQTVDVFADYLVKTGNDYVIEVANNGEWTSGEFFEQLCETFHCEGYEEVILESAGGRVIFNAEGVTFEGNVRIEGSLAYESGSPEEVERFLSKVNSPDIPHMKMKFLQSPHSKKPMIGMPYTLYADGSEIQRGMTDKFGEVEIPHNEGIQKYEIRFANGALYSIPVINHFEKNTENDEIINEGFYQYSDNQSALEMAKTYYSLVKGIFKH